MSAAPRAVYRPIVCVDFDGVLHSYTSGWQGAGVVSDPPMPGAIAWLHRLTESPLSVCIYSSRSKSLRGRRAMKRWLRAALREYFGAHPTVADDVFSLIRWPWFKPAATVTIDDRAWRFRGYWPEPAELRAFRPWKCGAPIDADAHRP